MIEHAIKTAIAAHAGQLDKAGEPYILHPLRVMLMGKNDMEKIVGVLHDVVEDTAVTVSDLIEWYGVDVAVAVEHLTCRPNETYSMFIRRCALDPVARQVKMHDLTDNMDPRRPMCAGHHERMKRYNAAMTYLTAPD